MSTMSPEELLRLWSLEKITVEMAMGHLIQHLLQLYKELEAAKYAPPRCQQEHEANQTETETETKTKTPLYQRRGFKKSPHYL